jgi:hypothetical protein
VKAGAKRGVAELLDEAAGAPNLSTLQRRTVPRKLKES